MKNITIDVICSLFQQPELLNRVMMRFWLVEAVQNFTRLVYRDDVVTFWLCELA
jgi:hypothetical protein